MKEISDKIVEEEKELEVLCQQRDAKLLPYMDGITFIPFKRDLPGDMKKAREDRLKQMN